MVYRMIDVPSVLFGMGLPRPAMLTGKGCGTS